jgi:hypothetical protein
MVIERFRNGDASPVYQRFADRGRMLPDGLEYVASWTTADMRTCFQLMRCDDRTRFDLWISRWDDLVDFEVVPVIPPDEAAARASTAGEQAVGESRT